jgi:FSR family fosmidomycin resistance protein-like MFS transporter
LAGKGTAARSTTMERSPVSRSKIIVSIIILMALIFSKYFYMASMTNYFTFYLIHKFGVSVQQSQLFLFAFLAAVAAGTILGGPLGDRYGRKLIIWVSILGAAPFSLLLPHVDLFATVVLAILVGLIISSAFSAILVYATELIPGKVGMIAGLFFGFAFGMGGIGSAVLGWLADRTGIEYVFSVCAYLPLIGIITGFLPNIEGKKGKV